MNPLHLIALPLGLLLAVSLTGCGNDSESLPATLASTPAARYPATDCRSKYSQSTQKGCAPTGVLFGQR